MAYIQGLPPLPKSLSGLLNFLPHQESPAPRENRYSPPTRVDSRTESLLDSRPESARSHHSMVGHGDSAFEPYYSNGGVQLVSSACSSPLSQSESPKGNQQYHHYGGKYQPVEINQRRNSPVQATAARSAPQPPPLKSPNLDSQLAVLRKEMVGLRQLDLSLLCQLWSLNESIQELNQIVNTNPGAKWRSESSHAEADWVGDTSAEDTDDYYGIPVRRPNPYLHPVSEKFTHPLSPSSSESSLEYGNI